MASKTKAAGPDLKQYLDKKLSLKLNGGRVVVGVLLVSVCMHTDVCPSTLSHAH